MPYFTMYQNTVSFCGKESCFLLYKATLKEQLGIRMFMPHSGMR